MGFVLTLLAVVSVAARSVASGRGTCNAGVGLGYAPAAARCSWHLAIWSIIILMGGCHKDFATHDFQSNPTSRISIVGTIPDEVAIELTADWQATVVDDTCAPLMGWPVGVRFPKHFSTVIKMEGRSGGQATWFTWWDAIAPGHCNWQLTGINFRADSSASAFATHAGSIAPSRIAFTCFSACMGSYPRANDNESDPVRQYCKFSLLLGINGMANPCAFGSNGTIAGPVAAAVKEQHILRPGQHVFRFSITDLESNRMADFTPAVPQEVSSSGQTSNNRWSAP